MERGQEIPFTITSAIIRRVERYFNLRLARKWLTVVLKIIKNNRSPIFIINIF